MDKRNDASVVIRGAFFGLLALITILVYIPALHNSFVNWDDPDYVYENQLIRSIDLRLLKYVFTRPLVSNWHPLTIISYAVDFRIWGLDPFGYHLTNVIFHGLNTFLVGLLTIRLYSVRGKANSYSATLASAVVALLFGLHPLHVESVAWISERKDVLFGSFYILSLLVYVKYAESRKGWVFFYSLALVFFTLALLSKPMAISLPLVLLVLDFYPLKRSCSLRRGLIEKTPFFVLSAVSGYLTLWAQAKGGGIATVAAYPLGARVIGSVQALIFYIYKTVVPLKLVPYYPWYHGAGLLDPVFIAKLLATVFITAFAVIMVRKNRIFLAVWLSYIIMLGPVIGLVQVGGQAAADRYMYLPSLALFLLIGEAVRLLSARYSRNTSRLIIIFMLVTLMTFLAIRTISQEAIWKDSITLWSTEIDAFPGRVNIAYNNRGLAFEAIGDHRKAIEDYTEAIKIHPFSRYVSPYNNRGLAYEAIGEYGKAFADYSMAITLNPELPEPYMNRGRLYEKFGEYKKAIEDFERARMLSKQAANRAGA